MADIRGHDINGRAVILRSNGTWSYIGQPGSGGLNQPGPCRHYADVAVQQYQANVRKGCGFTGKLWSPDYNYHYDWCLTVHFKDSTGRFKARNAALARCKPGPVNAHAAYLGCYIDKPERDLPKAFKDSNAMTTAACIRHCAAKGYRYAGTQFARQCFCGNSYGRYGRAAAKECNYKCSGNARQNCGGYWRNSIYKLH